LASIWIVSESSGLLSTLAHHLEPLGEIWLGGPERGDFKDAPGPDLLILCGVAGDSRRHEALERMLAFVRQVPQTRRAAAPVLYIAAEGEARSAARLERLFDDRHIAQLRFPFDPDELHDRASELLDAHALPISLRERARQSWVTREVERLYAGIDLPALRQAIDPRNAHRAVLMVGESGTRRDLLARYVHNLAEPARDVLVPIVLPSVAAGELERTVMARTAGRRSTVYLSDVERAGPAMQEELAQLLGASGAVALEPLRWIAATTHSAAIDRSLREGVWLRVELPPLRDRSDASALIDACFRNAAERQSRELLLEPAAREQLVEYTWPGNLRELERVAEASCAAATGARIGASDLRIAGRVLRVEAPRPAEASSPGQSAAPETFEHSESTDEDLMLATLEASEAPVPGELLAELSPEFEPEEFSELETLEPEPEPMPEPMLESQPIHEPVPGIDSQPVFETQPAYQTPPVFDPPPMYEPQPIRDAQPIDEPAPIFEPAPPSTPTPLPPVASSPLSSRDLVLPLAQTIRGPLRAVRTYASLVEQRPDDSQVRHELCALVERDLGGLEDTLQRVERFARLGVPVPRPFDLASLLGAELDSRQPLARSKSLVVLRELDTQAPPLVADKNQIRLAFGALLDLALRLVPQGGDLYQGSAWRPGLDGRAGGHRILLRFHSPEDVLTGPGGEADGEYLEVVIARELVQRAGGSFAVDASGAQDNVILIELPG